MLSAPWRAADYAEFLKDCNNKGNDHDIIKSRTYHKKIQRKNNY